MTANKSTLTQERLKELLNCDISAGYFTWKVNRGRVSIGESAGSLNKEGYISIQIDGKRYLAHRLVWLYKNGEFPTNEIDHINHIRNDNRIENLRHASHHKNGRNQSLHVTNTSGVSGVRLSRKVWRASIYYKGECF